MPTPALTEHSIAGLRSEIREELETTRLLELAEQAARLPEQALLDLGFEIKRVAVLSGYTSTYICRLIRLFCFKQGILCEIYESSYGAYEQLIHSKVEELKSFRPDICYFLVGSDHLGEQDPEKESARWLKLWQATHDWLGCAVVQNTFEEPVLRAFGNRESRTPQSQTSLVRQVNDRLATEAPSFVHFSDTNFLASFHGRKNWRDETIFDMAKLPVAFDLQGSYANNVARIIGALAGKSKKCLVLDLDNTLWGGVIGDDGIAGIDIAPGSPRGEAFLRFQKYIKALQERGVILAVCSKNEQAIAEEPFRNVPEMILKLSDFSCFIASWDPKPENLRRIAAELNIGLDSMVFVDDNPAERELVKRTFPEMAVLELPSDPAHFASALDRSGYFEATAITSEDLRRTEHYRANAARKTQEEKAGSYEDFLRDLQMRAKVARFDAANLPRIAQLIHKTNQFNLTGRRYSELELSELMARKNAIPLYLKLSDRFGDNGLVSAIVGMEQEPNTLVIDCWVMSCRVLHREAESFLLGRLIDECTARGIRYIKGTYRPTPKNALVKDLLTGLGFERLSGDSSWQLDLAKAEVTGRIRQRQAVISAS